MNNLEKYKQKQANIYFTNVSFPNHQAKEDNFKAGFDAALALDLPVKFAEHLHKEYIRESGGYWRHKDSRDSLYASTIYTFWIDNIYKPK